MHPNPLRGRVTLQLEKRILPAADRRRIRRKRLADLRNSTVTPCL